MVKDYMAKNDFSGKKNTEQYFHMDNFAIGLDTHPMVIADLLNGGDGGMWRCKEYGPYGHPKFGKRITACWWVSSTDAPVVCREADYKFDHWVR